MEEEGILAQPDPIHMASHVRAILKSCLVEMEHDYISLDLEKELESSMKALSRYIQWGFLPLNGDIDAQDIFQMILNALFQLRASAIIPTFISISHLHATAGHQTLLRAMPLVVLVMQFRFKEASIWLSSNRQDLFEPNVSYWDTEFLYVALMFYPRRMEETMSYIVLYVRSNADLRTAQLKDLISLIYVLDIVSDDQYVSEVNKKVASLFDKVWKSFFQENGIPWTELPSRALLDEDLDMINLDMINLGFPLVGDGHFDVHTKLGMILNALYQLRAFHIIPAFIQHSALQQTEGHMTLPFIALMKECMLREASMWLSSNRPGLFGPTVPFWDTQHLYLAFMLYQRREKVETVRELEDQIGADNYSITRAEIGDFQSLVCLMGIESEFGRNMRFYFWL
ncbi:unnamed protein product [Cuscuta campestris]|uniref:Uncharacterized protein n=1 Tax=Cuscuta campestris TaxID=132261 RepID=A0A484LXJ7_9ASTE|nr:unnamed protein product [Cuscuta campestris]